jgi:hypothetical protein
MSKAIGTILILYTISKIFADGVDAVEEASVATFNTIETAAKISELQLQNTVAK